MGLRQMLPVQTKRTYFTMRDAAARASAKGKIKLNQVNEHACQPLSKQPACAFA
jgi:hypothetical protein